MGSDFWSTRMAGAKRPFDLDRLNLDEIENEEETRPEYPCPYCFEEFDIASLCSHLEDDHSTDTKPAVCPLCALTVLRNMRSHIMTQHGHLFRVQRRRRTRRVGMPNSPALSLLGRDLREAQLRVLLGESGHRSNTSTSSNAAIDPFLSSLGLNLSASETDVITESVMSTIEDNYLKSKALEHMWKARFDSSLTREEREQRMRQAAGRAVFVQDLLISTLLTEW